MSKTSSRSIFYHYTSGLTTYLPVVTLARFTGLSFESPISVLDFGCGVGRQLLHTTRNFPKVRYFACDVDSTLIAFIQKNYPMVNAHVNNFVPPLQFPDNSMNLVYSVSTFSHFDLETQQLWLRELFRITKPGGLCTLSTEGRRALEMMRDTFAGYPDLEQTLARDGILYKEYSWLKSARDHKPVSAKVNVARGIHGSYGNTVMIPEYINKDMAGFRFRSARHFRRGNRATSGSGGPAQA